MNFRKTFRTVHVWLSVPFGIIITVMCLTGGILVFEKEIKTLTSPGLYKSSGDGPRMELPAIVGSVTAQLPDTVRLSSVAIPADPGSNYNFGVEGGGRTSVMVDPRTAEVKGTVRPYAKGEFFSVVRRLHRWFMFPMQRDKVSIGKIITGVSTLVFVFILLTGLVIWIPRTAKALRHRLTIKVRNGRLRFWYDTHIVGGFYALIFLLVMCLTGLTWSFEWYRNGFYKVFGVEASQGGSQQGHAAGAGGRERGQGDAGRRDSERGGGKSDEAAAGSGGGTVHLHDAAASAGAVEIPAEQAGSTARPEAVDGSTGNSGRTSGDNDDSRGRSRETRGERNDNDRSGSRDERSGNRPESRVSPNGNSGSRPEGGPRGGRGGADTQVPSPDYAVWQAVADKLLAENPKARTVSVQNGSATVSINSTGNTRASDRYDFNPATGEITGSTLYRDQPKSGKIRGWIYAFHVGTWGGTVTRILYLLACLIGTLLPVTGYYFYFKRLIKKRRKRD